MKTIKLTATKNMRSVLKEKQIAQDISGRKHVNIQGRSHQHKVFQKYGTYERTDVSTIDELPSWVVDVAYQHELVNSILHDMEHHTEWSSLYNRCLTEEQSNWIIQQMEQKMDGYVRQDKEKQKRNTPFDVHDRITLYDALQKIKESDYRCHYCNELLRLVYRITRDKHQWTLDRIDNDRGHDKDNLVISCYSCNIRRRKQSYVKFKEEHSVKHFDKLD